MRKKGENPARLPGTEGPAGKWRTRWPLRRLMKVSDVRAHLHDLLAAVDRREDREALAPEALLHMTLQGALRLPRGLQLHKEGCAAGHEHDPVRDACRAGGDELHAQASQPLRLPLKQGFYVPFPHLFGSSVLESARVGLHLRV